LQGLSFATNFAQAVRAVKDGTVVYSGNKNKKNPNCFHKQILIKLY
jgi:ABC-type enterochelin transport system ATPase subunit